MFYIKLTEDKNLEITVREPIYRGESLNGKIVFLLPETVDELVTEACPVYLNVIRADGRADIVLLERLEEKYEESWWQFTLPITDRLTRFPGQMDAFLQLYGGSAGEPQIVKSGACRLTVEESPDMDQYFNADRLITALYQYDKRVKSEFERVDAALAQKADGLRLDAETGALQLTAAGEPVGDAVIVRPDGTTINRLYFDNEGGLIAVYTDGTSESVGVVSGV